MGADTHAAARTRTVSAEHVLGSLGVHDVAVDSSTLNGVGNASNTPHDTGGGHRKRSNADLRDAHVVSDGNDSLQHPAQHGTDAIAAKSRRLLRDAHGILRVHDVSETDPALPVALRDATDLARPVDGETSVGGVAHESCATSLVTTATAVAQEPFIALQRATPPIFADAPFDPHLRPRRRSYAGPFGTPLSPATLHQQHALQQLVLRQHIPHAAPAAEPLPETASDGTMYGQMSWNTHESIPTSQRRRGRSISMATDVAVIPPLSQQQQQQQQHAGYTWLSPLPFMISSATSSAPSTPAAAATMAAAAANAAAAAAAAASSSEPTVMMNVGDDEMDTTEGIGRRGSDVLLDPSLMFEAAANAAARESAALIVDGNGESGSNNNGGGGGDLTLEGVVGTTELERGQPMHPLNQMHSPMHPIVEDSGCGVDITAEGNEDFQRSRKASASHFHIGGLTDNTATRETELSESFYDRITCGVGIKPDMLCHREFDTCTNSKEDDTS